MAEVSQSELYFFIKMMVHNDHTAPDILFYLVNVYGVDFISQRRVQDIVKEFKSGERLSHKRKEGSGRRSTSTTEENIQAVRQLVENDISMNCKQMSEHVGIPARSVNRILVDKLKKKCVKAKWVPHMLTEANKERRVVVGRQVLNVLNRRISKRLVVTDEKWIYHRNTPSSAHQHFWVDSGGDRPQQPKKTISAAKSLLMMATNFHGESYFELLQEGETVDSERYIVFLRNVVNHFRSLHEPVMPENMLLMHDNARPHVAHAVTEFINQQNITVIPQPPYSPDFNLLDRVVFRNYEVFRLGENFASRAEILDSITEYTDTFSMRQFLKQLESLKSDITSIIELNGNYL